jgi:hypothetical protein
MHLHRGAARRADRSDRKANVVRDARLPAAEHTETPQAKPQNEQTNSSATNLLETPCWWVGCALHPLVGSRQYPELTCKVGALGEMECARQFRRIEDAILAVTGKHH